MKVMKPSASTMSESERSECIDVAVPQGAIEIKVASIISPHCLRIYEVTGTSTIGDNLSTRLQKVLRSQLKRRPDQPYTPSVRDDVIVRQADLPGWICRGVVTDTSAKTTDVFLLDYGIVVNVPTDSLVKYPRSRVPVEPLTYAIGINVVPLVNGQVSEEWPPGTTDIVVDLISSSEKIYFSMSACGGGGKSNTKWGDLFLVLENKNICLSKVLIHGLLAISVFDELAQTIQGSSEEGEIIEPYRLEQPKAVVNDNAAPQRSVIDEQSKRKTSMKSKQMNEKMLIRGKFTCQPLEHLENSRFADNNDLFLSST